MAFIKFINISNYFKMTAPSKICAINNVNTDGEFSLVKRDNRHYENYYMKTKNGLPLD
jgi:hypothetical protein